VETKAKESPSLPSGGSPSLSNLGLPSTSPRPAESQDEADKEKRQEEEVTVPPGTVLARVAKNRSDSDGSVSAKRTGASNEGLKSGGSGGPIIVSDESISIIAIDTEGVTFRKRTRSDTGEEDDSSPSPNKPPGKVATKKPARGPNRPGPKSRKGSA
jgi:hypothetical protein